MKTSKRSRRDGRGVSAVILLLSLGLSLCVFPFLPEEAVRAAGLTTTELRNPTTNADGVTTWDYIYFGNYWQNDTNGDGVADQNDEKEPIKWRVLSVDGNDAFLLADQNLDSQPYNEIGKDVTWETCTLRKWLNSDFLNNAFDSSEQAAIMDTIVVNEDNPFYGTEGGNDTVDKVYLLSIAEASNTTYGFYEEREFGDKARISSNTAYVAYVRAPDWWLLRSPGCESEQASRVFNIKGYIDDYGDYVGNYSEAVRPVLHLNLLLAAGSGNDFDDRTDFPPISTGESTVAGGSAPVTSTPDIGVQTESTPSVGNTDVGTVAPARVKFTFAKRKKGGMIALQYKKVSGAKGYQVQYSAKKNFKGKKSKVASRTKYTIKKWKKKKTCYIRIRAYKLQAGKKVYGKWSRVKKVS